MKDIYYNHKKVGVFKQDNHTFITPRNTEKHYFIKYQGYGISSSILQQLKNLGCTKIIIIEQRTDNTQHKLITTLHKFFEKGQHYTDKQADQQRILNIKEFDNNG